MKKTPSEELGKYIANLEELKSINDLPFQVNGLKKLQKKLEEDTPDIFIHGSGTGDN